MKHHYVAASMLVLLTACSKAPSEAQQLANVLTGDAKGAAADNPACKLFSNDEVSAYSGKSLDAGVNAGMGMGCQWSAGADGSAMVMVTLVPPNYADRPSGAPHFRELPGIGTDGYVAEDMGGWIAGTSTAKEFIKVTVTGPKASDATAIALLQETLKRHP